jgi:hypothetical protein
VSEAVIGLVGVFVGAVSAGVAQWALARRRERAEARAAARLVSIELRRSAEILGDWLDRNSWWFPYWESPQAWPENQAKLALARGVNAWSAVVRAYARLDHIDRSTRDLASAGSLEYDALKLNTSEREQLEADASDVDSAVAALARFTRDSISDRPLLFPWHPSRRTSGAT